MYQLIFRVFLIAYCKKIGNILFASPLLPNAVWNYQSVLLGMDILLSFF